MWKLGVCVVLLASSIHLLNHPMFAHANAIPADPGKVSVHLLCAEQRAVVGERISVRVEVENRGDAPLIFANLISEADRLDGHVEFHLIDPSGRESRRTRQVADSFAPYPKEPDWKLLLGRWVVLYPGYSMTAPLELDAATFWSLKTPGKYKLTAEYSSGGLSDPQNYRPLGFKEHDVASLPFASWSGKVQSNSVWLSIVPAQGQGVMQH
jgi:hypothetical protein